MNSVNNKKTILRVGSNTIMLNWAVTFLIIAIIAGVFGLSGIAGTATQIAWILFVISLVIALVAFIRGRKPKI